MGLRFYVEDEEVKTVLSEYGELKSEVIHLKYKADHDLAGLENGNRLVKMVLDKPTIPYSLCKYGGVVRIGGEWCRVIHNNQQKVCTECSELGHTKRNCPRIRCRVCSWATCCTIVSNEKNKMAKRLMNNQQQMKNSLRQAVDNHKPLGAMIMEMKIFSQILTLL